VRGEKAVIAAVQCVAALIGRWGCYFLCILRLAEKLLGKMLDPFHLYVLAVQSHYMRENCFLDFPGGLLGALAGGRWRVLKAGDGLDSAGNAYDLPLAYVLQPGELEIDRYEVPGETEGHFIDVDGWDPYGDSRTVRDGRLVSRRIFRRTS
jgi:hypothetical protein